MPTKLPGASRSDAFKFEGQEIANLKISPQLVRWGGLDEDHVDYLAQDIAARGQQTPVLIRKAASGKPELVAGRHRHAAVLKINEDPAVYDLPADAQIPLKAVYKNLSDEEAAAASFAENTGLPLRVMDLAFAAEQFARLDWTGEKIAEVMSAPHHPVSKSRVSQLRSLIRLPHSIQKMLQRGTISESAARGMLALELEANEMEETARLIEAGEMSASDLKRKENATKRQKGKVIKRTMAEIKDALEDLGTGPAMDFLQWIEGGETIDWERIEEIFDDE